MDANHVVLLGGQDGGINASTFPDQVPLWLTDAYVQIPLRPETVRIRIAHAMVLTIEQGRRRITERPIISVSWGVSPGTGRAAEIGRAHV